MGHSAREVPNRWVVALRGPAGVPPVCLFRETSTVNSGRSRSGHRRRYSTPDSLYTVYEIARLLQGLEPDAQLEPATEDILLDWAIPWMLYNAESFVFAEPQSDTEPGYYGLVLD